MNSLLDRFAYRIFSRLSAYTPHMHYELRRRMSIEMPELMSRSRFRFPYWFAVILSRLAGLCWFFRDLGQECLSKIL